MESRSLLAVSGAALAGVVVGFILGAASLRAAAPGATPTFAHAPADAELSATLARIEARLGAIELAGSADQAERRPLRSDELPSAWIESLAKLQLEIDSLRELTAERVGIARASSSLGAAWREQERNRRPIDENAIADLLREIDYGQIRQRNFSEHLPPALLLLDPSAVVAKYGWPSTILTDGGGLRLFYDCDLPHPDNTAKYLNSVMFKFDSGLLSNLQVWAASLEDR